MKESTKRTIDDYVNKKYEPGSFIYAVLTNDLFGAFSCADSKNKQDMDEIIKYIYNKIPSGCWGNEEIVKNWLNH